ncbi:MAG: glycogen/starch/alpha-glucan family phosphorylase, partial [Clostridia bacterium]|nr:glycogen/starch/alpha-glucan family phosphorylase [Clostridia bacterium]
EALDIARRTFNYTNHTLMSEALETWDIELFKTVIPNIYTIIEKIDARLENDLTSRGIGGEKLHNMHIIADGRIHMARLATYVSTYVNGVAKIHSGLLRTEVLKDWYEVWPERFQNKTNGITQRRFLGLCNPGLSRLIGERIGYGFLTDLDELKQLGPMIDDAMIDEFISVKKSLKQKLSRIIAVREGVDIPADFVFDVQVKRMHEYKRQLMNALSIVHIYKELKAGRLADMPNTAFIFGAKAAPGYFMAKNIIKFINEIAHRVNSDPDVNGKIRVVFCANYNCSYAEHIIPAADISEQISPAGTEASGTGNMKFMLNGAVTLGTYDGANIEIVECAGEENNYIFGAKVEELARLRPHYDPKNVYDSDPNVRRAVDSLIDGSIANDPDSARVFREIWNSLLVGDWRKPDYYFNLYDFEDYVKTKLRAIYDTKNEREFALKCLKNTVNAGKFSSDRTIREYADEIWHIKRNDPDGIM